MIRATPQQVQAAAQASRLQPFMEYLAAWRKHELEALPMAMNNVAVAQGRCQVLAELNRFLLQAPELAANPQSGKPVNATHTD